MSIQRCRDHREGKFLPDLEEAMEFGQKEAGEKRGMNGSKQKALEKWGGGHGKPRGGGISRRQSEERNIMPN